MRKYIPNIFIGILLIACILQWTDRDSLKTKIATEEQKVKNLDEDVADLNLQIKGYDFKYNQMRDSVSGLKIQIANGKALIKTIQREHDEKLKIIDRYTVSDMQRFFDKRYGTKSKH